MKHTKIAICLALLGLAVVAGSDEKWSKDKQLAFYKEGLKAPSTKVREACVRALKEFPEAYAIMKILIETESNSSVTYAVIGNLYSMSLTEHQGKELFDLYLKLKKDAKKQSVAANLMEVLIKKYPERLRYYTLLTLIKNARNHPDLREGTIKQIDSALTTLPKGQRYRFVPILCDALLKTWSPYKGKVHALLVKITGKKSTYSRQMSNDDLYSLVEDYRVYYYTELRSKIEKIDPKFLDDPFGVVLSKKD